MAHRWAAGGERIGVAGGRAQDLDERAIGCMHASVHAVFLDSVAFGAVFAAQPVGDGAVVAA